jgi:acetamidase/formamidase
MERVDLRFDLVPERSLAMPRADTPAGWLTFGVHPDLAEAAHLAVDGMLHLMGEQYGLPRREALALASLLVDLRVSQICNGVVGAHAILPHGALR